jgi:flavin-binding protein dodecin
MKLNGSTVAGTRRAVLIDNALARAGESLHNLRWFEVTETRGNIEDGRVAHYQVGLKVGFSLDAGSSAG